MKRVASLALIGALSVVGCHSNVPQKESRPAAVILDPVPPKKIIALPETKKTKRHPERASRSKRTKVLTDPGVWDRLAACESTSNWKANTGNGFYGGIQFDLPSWHSAGGTGYPHHASREEQIKRGKIWKSRYGWKPWPACSRKLGLR